MVGVNHRLVVHRRMDGRYRARFDAIGVVQQLNNRNDAIGGAGSVGNNAVLTFEQIVVHAVDNGGVEVMTSGMCEQDFFSSCCKLRFAIFAAAINTSAVENHINTEFAPGQLGSIWLMQ